GTIVASGVQANAKGMAHHAKAKTHDWNNDLAEATTEAANGMLISNHSYGYRASLVPDWYFGAYLDESRDWDALMHNSPFYLMVVAAGNDGNDNSSNGAPLSGASSFDKLTGHSTSKNNMVVANGQDANVANDGTLNSVVINSGSSEGPTDDLRIKPDITGNGTQVYSTYDNSDVAYNSISGTSMASPNVAGTLLLLQQHYNDLNGNFMRSATLKGLALHTADDAGIAGPDAVYGWGLMNAKAAAEAISEEGNESIINELTLASGQTYTINVDANGVDELMASISWTDPAGIANTGTANLTTPVLVNDLDIRVTKSGSTFTPYRLTGVNSNTKGDNLVDPFERVDIAGASGTYTITVTNKGTLSGGSQNFTLIVTGLTGTPVVCNATTPTGLNVSGVGSSTATLSWSTVPGASYDVRYRVAGTSSWTTVAAGSSSANLSGLAVSTAYEAQVRSNCTDGSVSAYSSTINFTTTAVQLNYCASNGNSIADEYISRVQLGSINNVTGASASGYGNYTAQSTDLTKGTSNTITITPTWTGTLYNEGYSVFIDYNQDGDFTDAGEQVFSLAPSQATPVSGNFTVPAGAADGTTRMRVSMSYNATPAACGAFDFGEVEDYTVNIVGATADTQAPTAATGLAASAVTETTLTLSWNASTDNVGVTGYDIYSGTTVIGTSATNSTNLTSLTANTAYSFRVKAKDAAGNESGFSNTVNVTTAGGSTGSCTGGISSFPYAESFESNDGWTQVSGDDGNWVRDSGGTPSSGTGPSNGADGSFYMFLEASTNGSAGQIGANATAILESDCIDLSGESTATLSFQYHLYGTAVGSLTIQTSGDDGANWTNQWTLSGNQGNAWIPVNVSLAAFAGSTVKIRIVGTTGSSWSSDIAVDDIEITAGGGSSISCTQTVTNFSYTESFESGVGTWTQAAGDDGDWVNDSGGTPSGSTGPSNGASGSFYMFLEASTNSSPGQIGSNATAILESPCFDLSGVNATFNFSYHMYGSNMGTLRLEASVDGTSWTELWSLTGNQGNSWNTANVSLSAYSGSTIKLRFRGTTGSSWQSDMAIDNISFNATLANSLNTILEENIAEAFTVEVYPIPATGNILNVQGNRESLQYQIVSVSGQQMSFGKVENSQIDISRLANGVYMLKVVSGVESKNIRFIKK
ncbi:MAG: GEVED domain-containing protein, partial [Cyclobacteriaceae bacterium]